MEYEIKQTTNKTRQVGTGVKSFAEFNHFHESETYDGCLGVLTVLQTINKPGAESHNILQILHTMLLNNSFNDFTKQCTIIIIISGADSKLGLVWQVSHSLSSSPLLFPPFPSPSLHPCSSLRCRRH